MDADTRKRVLDARFEESARAVIYWAALRPQRRFNRVPRDDLESGEVFHTLRRRREGPIPGVVLQKTRGGWIGGATR